MFSSLLNSRYLPMSTKLLIYKVAIRPVLLYAFPIWFSISPTLAYELELLERNIIRKCIGKNYKTPTRRYSNNYLYLNSGIVPICQYALALQRKFVENLEHHDNPFLMDIYESEKHIGWSNSTFLSPIGILNEGLDNPQQQITPTFFTKSVPGSHRG